MPPERFFLAGAEILVGADIDETVRIAAGQFAALARKNRRRGQNRQRGSFRWQHAASSLSNACRRAFCGTRPVGLDPLLLGRRAQRASRPSGEQLFHGSRNCFFRAFPFRLRTSTAFPPATAPPSRPPISTSEPCATNFPSLKDFLVSITIFSALEPTDTPPRSSLIAQLFTSASVSSWPIMLRRSTPGASRSLLPVLNNAAQITFLVTGEDKASVVRQVIEGPRDPESTPAQLIAAANGALTWILDSAAASCLTRPALRQEIPSRISHAG